MSEALSTGNAIDLTDRPQCRWTWSGLSANRGALGFGCMWYVTPDRYNEV